MATRSEERVEVDRVFHPDVLGVTRDGGTVPFRLAGVDAVRREDHGLFEQAVDAVRTWTAEGPLALFATETNARGELTGLLRLAEGDLLNERLVAHGYALFDPGSVKPSYWDELHDAQVRARKLKAGFWASKLTAKDAPTVVGRIITICGPLGFLTKDRDGDSLLHMGEGYPRRSLTLRIPRERAADLDKAPERYLHHEVCATGKIKPGSLSPEMSVVDATQLRER